MQMSVGTCCLSNQSTQAIKGNLAILAITVPSYYYFLVIIPLKLILLFALSSGAQGSKGGDASPP